MSETIVIVGAGHAAGQCIATLRQRQHSGDIILVGEESWYPYQRPPLSKKYLSGELDAERLFYKPQNAYAGVDVRLNTRVNTIDPTEKAIRTDAGDVIGFDKLVLATGSRPRSLPVTGIDLKGVHYLRNIDDVDRIRNELQPDKKVVIIGAGYIGLEVAAVMAQMNLDVTVVEMEDRVMRRVVSEPVSAFYQRVHAEHGVSFKLSADLGRFDGDGRINSVVLGSAEVVPADIAIVGIGVVPNIELAADAGLQTANGIVVDDRCRSSDCNIYAIGDCTFHPNRILGRDIRLESVHNALEQAKVAAANLCGDDASYAQVPWFWSDQYDLKLQIAGLSTGFDDTVIRGNLASDAFACCYLRNGRLIAIDAVNSPRDFVQAKALIANGARIDKELLADADVQLKDIGNL